MSKIEKLKQKFYRKPIPNDITFAEIEVLAKYYGCIVRAGTNHMHIVYPRLGRVIPIPTHNKHIGEVYIKQLKELFREIEAREGEEE